MNSDHIKRINDDFNRANNALRKLSISMSASKEEFRQAASAMKNIKTEQPRRAQWKQSPLERLRNK